MVSPASGACVELAAEGTRKDGTVSAVQLHVPAVRFLVGRLLTTNLASDWLVAGVVSDDMFFQLVSA